MSHLRQEVRGRRCDEHEIRLVGEADVVDLALFTGVEEVATHRLAGHGLQRERRDEALGLGREGAANFVARALQGAHEFGRLIGGDSPRDRE